MMSYCQRCGSETELYTSPEGSMYCLSCIEATRPRCIDCVKCHQRKCGDAIYACPFCHLGTEKDAQVFEKEARRAEPIRIEEKCERCGGPMHGRAFILHGKALCKKCLIYEQDQWEVVPGKPGKYGTKIKVVIEKPKKKLIRLLDLDPDDLPKDPFASAKIISETRMADDSCKNCEAYEKGRKSAKFMGAKEGK